MLLRDAMTPEDDQAVNQVLSPSGPIGSFATKCRVAYVFGLMSKTTYEDFSTIAKIRNRFAHELPVKEYSDPKIDRWIRSLHMSKLIEAISKSELEPNASNFDRWFKFCMEQELQSGASAYRTAIRLYSMQMPS
jgi:DNA-binding MltR family transcriptional regulator